MASIFTHPVIAIAFSPWLNKFQKRQVIISGVVLSIFPDIDVIAFKFGIPYEHLFGHRGITHSIAFAMVLSGLVACYITRSSKKNAPLIWFYLFICTVSHGVLDAMTNGGLGIAFLAPFSNERYFFPIQPINVSSLRIGDFFSEHGLFVMKSEIVFIWIPFSFVWGINYLFSRIKN